MLYTLREFCKLCIPTMPFPSALEAICATVPLRGERKKPEEVD